MSDKNAADLMDIEDNAEARRAERQKFWHDSAIPVNEDWQEDQTNFANPVEVADMFARATGIASMLASDAEELTEAIANAEFLRDDAQILLTKLRRTIISDNFSAMKSSWNSEALEAFILASAGDHRATLLELEKDVENAQREIRIRKPQLDKIKNRLKRLDTNMDWAKEWLNFDKLMQRITESGRK